MSKKTVISGHFTLSPRVVHAFMSMARVRSQTKRTYVLSVTRSCFLWWVGREMVTGIGHVEMGTGREEEGGGGGVVVKGGDGEACRRWWGGNRERARLVDWCVPREMEEGGQEGGGQWGGGISVMEYLGGHTFPEQRWVTQLVYNTVQICSGIIHAECSKESFTHTEFRS